jgi:hypothetical protein
MHYVTRLLILAPILIAGYGNAQHPQRLPGRVVVSEKTFADCYDSNQKLVGSMLVRRPVLVSPNGNYQAYAENEAIAYRGAGAECVTTAKLFVKGPADKDFRLVYLQEPHLYELISQIDLVDWSPDSHYLLAELFIGQQGSDFGGFSPLLYNAWDGVFSPENFVSTALSIHVGRDCPYVVQSLGFAPNGGVVLKVGPVIDEEGIMDPGSCVKGVGLWMLNHDLTPLADTYKVQRYGHLLAGRSNM